MTRSWYDIKATAGGGTEIYLYDEIGGWGVSARDFIAEVKALSGQPIALHIHSPGGSVLDGHAIYNALLRHKGGLTVQIDGLAASMAGVVAMAGRPVRMAENAFLMIHNPWSVSIGEAEQMRKDADLLDRMKDGMVNIYAQKSGKDEDEIEAMMDAETWLTATEAKEMGFIDEVTDRLEMAAKFDLTKFQRTPTALVDTANIPKPMSDPIKNPETLAEITERYNAAAEQAKQNFAALQVMTAERDTLKASMQALSTEVAEANLAKANALSELALFRSKETERVNEEAARIVASSGHPVLNISTEQSTNAGTPTDRYIAAVERGDLAERRKLLAAYGREITAELAKRR